MDMPKTSCSKFKNSKSLTKYNSADIWFRSLTVEKIVSNITRVLKENNIPLDDLGPRAECSTRVKYIDKILQSFGLVKSVKNRDNLESLIKLHSTKILQLMNKLRYVQDSSEIQEQCQLSGGENKFDYHHPATPFNAMISSGVIDEEIHKNSQFISSKTNDTSKEALKLESNITLEVYNNERIKWNYRDSLCFDEDNNFLGFNTDKSPDGSSSRYDAVSSQSELNYCEFDNNDTYSNNCNMTSQDCTDDDASAQFYNNISDLCKGGFLKKKKSFPNPSSQRIENSTSGIQMQTKSLNKPTGPSFVNTVLNDTNQQPLLCPETVDQSRQVRIPDINIHGNKDEKTNIIGIYSKTEVELSNENPICKKKDKESSDKLSRTEALAKIGHSGLMPISKEPTGRRAKRNYKSMSAQEKVTSIVYFLLENHLSHKDIRPALPRSKKTKHMNGILRRLGLNVADNNRLIVLSDIQRHISDIKRLYDSHYIKLNGIPIVDLSDNNVTSGQKVINTNHSALNRPLKIEHQHQLDATAELSSSYAAFVNDDSNNQFKPKLLEKDEDNDVESKNYTMSSQNSISVGRPKHVQDELSDLCEEGIDESKMTLSLGSSEKRNSENLYYGPYLSFKKLTQQEKLMKVASYLIENNQSVEYMIKNTSVKNKPELLDKMLKDFLVRPSGKSRRMIYDMLRRHANNIQMQILSLNKSTGSALVNTIEDCITQQPSLNSETVNPFSPITTSNNDITDSTVPSLKFKKLSLQEKVQITDCIDQQPSLCSETVDSFLPITISNNDIHTSEMEKINQESKVMGISTDNEVELLDKIQETIKKDVSSSNMEVCPVPAADISNNGLLSVSKKVSGRRAKMRYKKLSVQEKVSTIVNYLLENNLTHEDINPDLPSKKKTEHIKKLTHRLSLNITYDNGLITLAVIKRHIADIKHLYESQIKKMALTPIVDVFVNVNTEQQVINTNHSAHISPLKIHHQQQLDATAELSSSYAAFVNDDSSNQSKPKILEKDEDNDVESKNYLMSLQNSISVSRPKHVQDELSDLCEEGIDDSKITLSLGSPEKRNSEICCYGSYLSFKKLTQQEKLMKVASYLIENNQSVEYMIKNTSVKKKPELFDKMLKDFLVRPSGKTRRMIYDLLRLHANRIQMHILSLNKSTGSALVNTIEDCNTQQSSLSSDRYYNGHRKFRNLSRQEKVMKIASYLIEKNQSVEYIIENTTLKHKPELLDNILKYLSIWPSAKTRKMIHDILRVTRNSIQIQILCLKKSTDSKFVNTIKDCSTQQPSLCSEMIDQFLPITTSNNDIHNSGIENIDQESKVMGICSDNEVEHLDKTQETINKDVSSSNMEVCPVPAADISNNGLLSVSKKLRVRRAKTRYTKLSVQEKVSTIVNYLLENNLTHEDISPDLPIKEKTEHIKQITHRLTLDITYNNKLITIAIIDQHIAEIKHLLGSLQNKLAQIPTVDFSDNVNTEQQVLNTNHSACNNTLKIEHQQQLDTTAEFSSSCHPPMTEVDSSGQSEPKCPNLDPDKAESSNRNKSSQDGISINTSTQVLHELSDLCKEGVDVDNQITPSYVSSEITDCSSTSNYNGAFKNFVNLSHYEKVRGIALYLKEHNLSIEYITENCSNIRNYEHLDNLLMEFSVWPSSRTRESMLDTIRLHANSIQTHILSLSKSTDSAFFNTITDCIDQQPSLCSETVDSFLPITISNNDIHTSGMDNIDQEGKVMGICSDNEVKLLDKTQETIKKDVSSSNMEVCPVPAADISNNGLLSVSKNVSGRRAKMRYKKLSVQEKVSTIVNYLLENNLTHEDINPDLPSKKKTEHIKNLTHRLSLNITYDNGLITLAVIKRHITEIKRLYDSRHCKLTGTPIEHLSDNTNTGQRVINRNAQKNVDSDPSAFMQISSSSNNTETGSRNVSYVRSNKSCYRSISTKQMVSHIANLLLINNLSYKVISPGVPKKNKFVHICKILQSLGLEISKPNIKMILLLLRRQITNIKHLMVSHFNELNKIAMLDESDIIDFETKSPVTNEGLNFSENLSSLPLLDIGYLSEDEISTNTGVPFSQGVTDTLSSLNDIEYPNGNEQTDCDKLTGTCTNINNMDFTNIKNEPYRRNLQEFFSFDSEWKKV